MLVLFPRMMVALVGLFILMPGLWGRRMLGLHMTRYQGDEKMRVVFLPEAKNHPRQGPGLEYK